MKQLFLLLTVAASSVMANGESFSSLSFATADGKVVNLPVENLEISISDGTLFAGANGATAVSFRLDDLTSMQFSSDTPTGISSLTSTLPSSVTVYRPDGVVAGTFTSLDEARNLLPRGIYIIKDYNANSLKISIK